MDSSLDWALVLEFFKVIVSWPLFALFIVLFISIYFSEPIRHWLKSAFFSQEKGVVLPVTDTYRDYGFESFKNTNSRIVEMALQKVEPWRASSPFITAFLSKALRELQIFYVKSRLAFKDQMAFIPKDLKFPDSSLRLGAFYISEFGTFIEKTTFDSLSLQNQMALLIHEGLRHQQMGFNSGMSNEDLQKLTAFLLREPAPGLSLDNVAYLNPLLQRLLNDAKRDIQVGLYGAEACHLLPEVCELLKLDDVQDNLSKIIIKLGESSMDFRYRSSERESFYQLSNRIYSFFKENTFRRNDVKTLARGYYTPLVGQSSVPELIKLARKYNEGRSSPKDRQNIDFFIELMFRDGFLIR